MSFHLKLYAAKNYLNKHGTPQTINDLSKHRLLTYDNDESSLTQPMDWLLITGLSSARPRNSKLAMNSSLNLAYAVKNGAGIVSLRECSPYAEMLARRLEAHYTAFASHQAVRQEAEHPGVT